MIEIYYDGLDHLREEEAKALDCALRRTLELEEIEGPGELSVSLVNAEEIQELNSSYRGIDKQTDVLSFPQVASKEELLLENYKVLGDIVINMDMVRCQAEEFGHGVLREMIYLSIHSFYHLLGYDHEDALSKEIMRQKEEEAYGFWEGKNGN